MMPSVRIYNVNSHENKEEPLNEVCPNFSLVVYVCIYMSMCIYVCIFTYVYMCVYVCMYVCVYIYVYVNKLLYEHKTLRFTCNIPNLYANHYLSIIQQQRCNISGGISSTISNITLAEAKHVKEHDSFTY